MGMDGGFIVSIHQSMGCRASEDKNPGSEAKCKEALIKLQQGREQAGHHWWLGSWGWVVAHVKWNTASIEGMSIKLGSG